MNNLFYCNNNLPENLDNRSVPSQDNKKNNHKLDIKTMKKNTLNSLHEVEYFLNNFSSVTKYIKLYKILK